MNEQLTKALKGIFCHTDSSKLNNDNKVLAEKIRQNLTQDDLDERFGTTNIQQDERFVLNQVYANIQSKIYKNKQKVIKPKHSKVIWFSIPAIAAVLIAIFIIKIDHRLEKININLAGKSIALHQKEFNFNGSSLQKAKLAGEIDFEFSHVQSLFAQKNKSELSLSLKACKCKFSFHSKNIKKLSIQTPKAKYYVIGTVFSLNVTATEEKLQVLKGKVKVISENKEFLVSGSKMWSSTTQEVKGIIIKTRKKIRTKPKAKYFTKGLLKYSNVVVTLRDKTKLVVQLKLETASHLILLSGSTTNQKEIKIHKSKILQVVKR